jgi:hypothetical protein
METTVITKYEYVYTKEKLEEKINQTIEKILDISKKMDYRVENEIKDFKFIDFSRLSKKQMKKINRYSYNIMNHPTLRNMNLFLHTISKFTTSPKMKISISLKEENIQKARAKYKEIQKKFDQLYKEYKNEKGDFYIQKARKLIF